MDTRTTTSAEPVEISAPAKDPLAPRVIVGAVAAVLMLLAIGLPLWATKLSAPQYPDGLTLTAYGNRVTGDVKEISALNHYVGMAPFDVSDYPEIKLWIPTVIAAVVAGAVATIFGRRWPGRLARLFVWAVPIGVLLDIQFRLYQAGHDLHEGAAIRVDPFTPLVLGPTKVLNFSVLALPGLGVLLFLLAAALLSFGPMLLSKVTGRVARSAPSRAGEPAGGP